MRSGHARTSQLVHLCLLIGNPTKSALGRRHLPLPLALASALNFMAACHAHSRPPALDESLSFPSARCGRSASRTTSRDSYPPPPPFGVGATAPGGLRAERRWEILGRILGAGIGAMQQEYHSCWSEQVGLPFQKVRRTIDLESIEVEPWKAEIARAFKHKYPPSISWRLPSLHPPVLLTQTDILLKVSFDNAFSPLHPARWSCNCPGTDSVHSGKFSLPRSLMTSPSNSWSAVAGTLLRFTFCAPESYRRNMLTRGS